MRLTTYKDILRSVVEQTGGVLNDSFLTEEGDAIRDFVSIALEDAWEREKWPDLLRCQERYLRDLYAAATAYAIGAEVYYPAEQKHYLAIRATTGNLPTDLAYWAEAKTGYTAADYSASTAYVAGDQVYYPTTDRFYQCHTAGTGVVPTNTANWGILVPFNPYISYDQTGQTAIGEVFWVGDRNRRVFTNTTRIPYELSDVGIQLLELRTKVWVEFRIRPPRLSGSAFDATLVYVAGDQIYYDTTGDFYTCLSTTSAGQDPVDTPAKWSKVEIPYIFKGELIRAATERMLKRDGQHEKAAVERAQHESVLGRQADKLFRQQSQTRRLTVQTR